jgi:hypothetical protein
MLVVLLSVKFCLLVSRWMMPRVVPIGDCTLGLPSQLTPKVQRPIYDQVQQGRGLPVFLLPFVTGWKDADADIPILKEVKAEYAKLQ